jgi:hypothetical protein
MALIVDDIDRTPLTRLVVIAWVFVALFSSIALRSGDPASGAWPS